MSVKGRRPERVAAVVRSVVSDAIATKLSDPRIAPLASVTRVEVSGDLEYAKVWISVLGDETVQRRTLAGLCSAAGYVQRLVGSELSIRHCPKVSFHLDLSLKKAAETIRLIEKVASEKRPQADSDAEPDDRDSIDPSSGEQA
jgi:ribosome-binding factor A